MRVLVTGWAGYIGPVILRHLKDAGYHTYGIDTGWYLRQYADEPEWPTDNRFEDICSYNRRAFRDGFGYGVVVHLAGLSNDPMSALDPDTTRAINAGGTMNVVFNHPEAHHVVVSSCSVYGTAEMATEETEPAPLTAYAEAKAEVDTLMAANGLSYTSLRLGTVYGYSPGHRLDLVVNRMTFDALAQGHVTATGNARRPLVHVEDVARAVLWAIERQPRGVYNIVGENLRMFDLGHLVADFAKVPLVRKPVEGDLRNYSASGDKAAREGFLPRHSVLGSLPVLYEKTLTLPAGRVYERLPIARRHLEPVAA